MNIETINTIKELITQIRKINMYENAISAYPNEDLEKIQATNDFSIANAIRLTDRSMVQLEETFNNPENQFLPFIISVPEVDGQSSSSIYARLNEMLNYAQAKDQTFGQIGSSLRWLISYQQAFGLWDKAEKKIHVFDEIKLKEQQKEISLLSEKLSEILKRTKDLSERQLAEINRLEEFHRIKSEEFSSLSNMVGKANNDASLITQYWEQATRQKGEFDNLINQANDNLKNLNAQIDTQKSEFSNLKSDITKSEDELFSTIQTTNDTLKNISNSKQQITERMAEATNLLGLSADAALGGKFNNRETTVRKTLFWWRIAIGITAGTAVIWAICVFEHFASNSGIPLLDILVNLVKTSPGFIIMGYVMAQYNKERAIEEEYAFKAAIAMTINSYANLLQENDSDENRSRQKMLLEAVKQVYTKPQMHKENEKNNSRELIEILKELAKK